MTISLVAAGVCFGCGLYCLGNGTPIVAAFDFLLAGINLYMFMN